MIKLTTEQISGLRAWLDQSVPMSFSITGTDARMQIDESMKYVIRLGLAVVESGVDVRGLRDGEASCMAMREAIAAEMERAR